MTPKDGSGGEGQRPKGERNAPKREGQRLKGQGQRPKGQAHAPKREGGPRKSAEGRQRTGERRQRRGGEDPPNRGGESRHSGHSTALGRAIRLVRNSQELSRADLAERTGLSYPYVSEIESGKKSGSSKSLMLIAEALGMRLHDLLEMADRLETGEPAAALKGIVDRSQKGSPPGSPWFRDSGHDRGVDTMTGPPYFVADLPPPPMVMHETEETTHMRREIHDLLDALSPNDLELVLRLIARLSSRR